MTIFVPVPSSSGLNLVNLGCGTRTHREWNNVDFSPMLWLKQHPRIAALARGIGVLPPPRWERLSGLVGTLIYWDLRRGIPFADGTIDVVYHSHVLEHIDRDEAPGFLSECRRVLRPGGILRVVVPDLRRIIDDYLRGLVAVSIGASDAAKVHEGAIEELFEQMVRTRGTGGRQLGKAIAKGEDLLRGGAGARGESHRWMYDAASLGRLLTERGYVGVTERTASVSGIAAWSDVSLDLEPDGTPYKPGSLYIEASNPG